MSLSRALCETDDVEVMTRTFQERPSLLDRLRGCPEQCSRTCKGKHLDASPSRTCSLLVDIKSVALVGHDIK